MSVVTAPFVLLGKLFLLPMRLLARLLLLPFRFIPGKIREKTDACRILRFFRWVIVIPLSVVFWLFLIISTGALGPLVRTVAPPLAKSFANIDLTIGRFTCYPFGGYICLEDLRVENPTAFSEKKDLYKETPLLKLGRVEFDLAVRALFAGKIDIDTIRLSGLRMLYAYDFDTNNVDALVAQMPARPEAAPEPEPEAKPEGEKKPVKTAPIHIGLLEIKDNSVTVRRGLSIPVPVPALTMKDIDSEKLKARFSAITATVKGVGTGVSATGDAIEGGADAIRSGARAVGKSLKNINDLLFGNDDPAAEPVTPEERRANMQKNREETAADLKKSSEDFKKSREDAKKSLKDIRDSLKGLKKRK